MLNICIEGKSKAQIFFSAEQKSEKYTNRINGFCGVLGYNFFGNYFRWD